MTDCLFCKIVNGEIPCDKVYEDEQILAFRDIAPKAETHILIIPKQHIVNLMEASDEQMALLAQILLTIRTIAQQENLEGYRVITNNGEKGGQEVFHMHWHLLAGPSLPGF